VNIFGLKDVYVALIKAIFVLYTYLRPPMVHLTMVQMHIWRTVRCYFEGSFQVLSFHPLFICSLFCVLEFGGAIRRFQWKIDSVQV